MKIFSLIIVGIFSILILFDVANGQSLSGTSINKFNVNGIEVKVVIPSGFGVKLIPLQIETSVDVSMLQYNLSLEANRKVYELSWLIYINDFNKQIVNKDRWIDKITNDANSGEKFNTVFEYKHKPGSGVTIALQKIITADEVINWREREIDKSIVSILRGRNVKLPTPKIDLHPDISNDTNEIFKLSFESIMNNSDLKSSLSISSESPVFLSSKGMSPNMFIEDTNVKLIGEEEIKSKISIGQSIKYFEFCCITTEGSSIKVLFNYYTPEIFGNAYINKGKRIELEYRKKNNNFILKMMRTVHF